MAKAIKCDRCDKLEEVEYEQNMSAADPILRIHHSTDLCNACRLSFTRWWEGADTFTVKNGATGAISYPGDDVETRVG